MGIGQFIKNWRETRRAVAAERERVERLFESFLDETRPHVSRSPKHPQAALYRHAWKRAAVLEILCQREADEERASLHQKFQELAGARYYRVAPSGPYGIIRLRMESSAATRLLEQEAKRRSPKASKRQELRPQACIYVGRCQEGRSYVGQTKEAPERRWLQHRADGTGPFKDGVQYVKWEVVEGNIKSAKLDERESYHIGLLDAFENGYNDTRGNDWEAYERGRAARAKPPPPDQTLQEVSD